MDIQELIEALKLFDNENARLNKKYARVRNFSTYRNEWTWWVNDCYDFLIEKRGKDAVIKTAFNKNYYYQIGWLSDFLFTDEKITNKRIAIACLNAVRVEIFKQINELEEV